MRHQCGIALPRGEVATFETLSLFSKKINPGWRLTRVLDHSCPTAGAHLAAIFKVSKISQGRRRLYHQTCDEGKTHASLFWQDSPLKKKAEVEKLFTCYTLLKVQILTCKSELLFTEVRSRQKKNDSSKVPLKDL